MGSKCLNLELLAVWETNHLKVSDHLHGDESLLGATFECCVLFDIGIKGCLVSKIGINRI